MKDYSPIIGKVLGLALIIVGFAYGNSGMWMIGIIVFVIGMYSKRLISK
ncbi:hypothetical protein IIB79_05345 [candidate division KSB1 bacterium]|nr:hypothetical protein [candidate division KSB1 bacterium]